MSIPLPPTPPTESMPSGPSVLGLDFGPPPTSAPLSPPESPHVSVRKLALDYDRPAPPSPSPPLRAATLPRSATAPPLSPERKTRSISKRSSRWSRRSLAEEIAAAELKALRDAPAADPSHVHFDAFAADHAAARQRAIDDTHAKLAGNMLPHPRSPKAKSTLGKGSRFSVARLKVKRNESAPVVPTQRSNATAPPKTPPVMAPSANARVAGTPSPSPTPKRTSSLGSFKSLRSFRSKSSKSSKSSSPKEHPETIVEDAPSTSDRLKKLPFAGSVSNLLHIGRRDDESGSSSQASSIGKLPFSASATNLTRSRKTSSSSRSAEDGDSPSSSLTRLKFSASVSNLLHLHKDRDGASPPLSPSRQIAASTTALPTTPTTPLHPDDDEYKRAGRVSAYDFLSHELPPDSPTKDKRTSLRLPKIFHKKDEPVVAYTPQRSSSRDVQTSEELPVQYVINATGVHRTSTRSSSVRSARSLRRIPSRDKTPSPIVEVPVIAACPEMAEVPVYPTGVAEVTVYRTPSRASSVRSVRSAASNKAVVGRSPKVTQVEPVASPNPKPATIKEVNRASAQAPQLVVGVEPAFVVTVPRPPSIVSKAIITPLPDTPVAKARALPTPPRTPVRELARVPTPPRSPPSSKMGARKTAPVERVEKTTTVSVPLNASKEEVEEALEGIAEAEKAGSSKSLAGSDPGSKAGIKPIKIVDYKSLLDSPPDKHRHRSAPSTKGQSAPFKKAMPKTVPAPAPVPQGPPVPSVAAPAPVAAGQPSVLSSQPSAPQLVAAPQAVVAPPVPPPAATTPAHATSASPPVTEAIRVTAGDASISVDIPQPRALPTPAHATSPGPPVSTLNLPAPVATPAPAAPASATLAVPAQASAPSVAPKPPATTSQKASTPSVNITINSGKQEDKNEGKQADKKADKKDDGQADTSEPADKAEVAEQKTSVKDGKKDEVAVDVKTKSGDGGATEVVVTMNEKKDKNETEDEKASEKAASTKYDKMDKMKNEKDDKKGSKHDKKDKKDDKMEKKDDKNDKKDDKKDKNNSEKVAKAVTAKQSDKKDKAKEKKKSKHKSSSSSSSGSDSESDARHGHHHHHQHKHESFPPEIDTYRRPYNPFLTGPTAAPLPPLPAGPPLPGPLLARGPMPMLPMLHGMPMYPPPPFPGPAHEIRPYYTPSPFAPVMPGLSFAGPLGHPMAMPLTITPLMARPAQAYPPMGPWPRRP